jgi:hypothetical protein
MKEPTGPHDPGRQLTQALLAASPSIATKWADHLADWAPEQPPVYMDAMIFSHHLVDLVESSQTSELPAVFRAVEELMRTGDPGVRYLVTYGLIEGIQNVAANRHGYSFERRFREWLLPATETAWDEVHRMWGTQSQDPPRDIQRR